MAPRGENRAAKSALRAPTMAAISHPLPLYGYTSLGARLLPFLFVAKTLAKAKKRRLPPAAKQKRCLRSAVRRVLAWLWNGLLRCRGGFGLATNRAG